MPGVFFWKNSVISSKSVIELGQELFWYGVGRGANYAAKELALAGGYAEFVPIRTDIDKGMDVQVAAARAIADSGRAGKVQLYAFDTDPEIISYIKKGIIACTIGQDSFGQGHDPVVWLYNHIAAKEPFPSDIIYCRVSVIDRNNVDSLIV